MLEKDKIHISFVGMDATDALKDYVVDKIAKKENILKEATAIDVFLKQEKSTKGVNNDFRFNINVSLPETLIRVEERGENMYVNIDKSMDILSRRLNRYNETKDQWSGIKSWKELETEMTQDTEEDNIDDYTHYVPKVSKRKTIENMSPMEEAEAIERMELLGYDQFLFKNKSTNKISMIYRRLNGTYGLIQPKD